MDDRIPRVQGDDPGRAVRETWMFKKWASIDSLRIWILRGLVIASCCALAWISVLSGKRLAYDEPYHLSNCLVLASHGFFSSAFFQGTGYSAAGPLYSVIYYLTSPVTGFHGPQVRTVNLILLFLTIWIWALILRRMAVGEPWLRAAMVFSIPPFWIIAGLALTEVPTMLVSSGAVYFVLRGLELLDHGRKGAAYGLVSLASVCFSLASLGRATYLLASLLLIACLVLTRKASIVPILILICGLIPSAIVFCIWGGFLPPGQTNVSRGISLNNALLGICYTTVIAGILSLDFSTLRDRLAGLLAGAAFLLNMVLGIFQRAPDLGLGLYGRTDALGLFYARLTGSVLVALALYFTVVVLKQLWEFWRERDAFRLWLLSTIAALSLTPLVITHLWSIRYALASIPFLVPLLGSHLQVSWLRVFVLSVAIVVGSRTLNHYTAIHFRDAAVAFPESKEAFAPAP